MKLQKILCEICGESNPHALHIHHIVERTDPNTNNDPMNCAVICASCHNIVHAGDIKIIGLYPSTKLPYKRILVYERDGRSNVPGITEAYYKPEAKRMKYGKQERNQE